MQPSNYLLDTLAHSLDISIPHSTKRQTLEAFSAGGTVMIITKRALDIVALDNQVSNKQSLLATTRKGEQYLNNGYYVQLPLVSGLGFNDFITGATHIGSDIDSKYLSDIVGQVNSFQQNSGNQYLTGNELFKLHGMTKKRLSFGDFITLRNNFHLHFLSLGWVSYNKEVSEKLKKENSKLYTEIQLLEEKKRNGGIDTEENFIRLKKLYQAYCIMIQYPSVEHNYELFR